MKNRYLHESFHHAISGLKQAMSTERNFRLDLIFGAMIMGMAIILGCTPLEWALLMLAMAFVMVTELLNTAIEYTVDMVCGKEYNELAKYSKDIAAGATLLAAIFAAVIGFLILGPKLLTWIQTFL